MAPQLLAWSHDMVAMYQARRDRAVEDAAVAATVAFSDFMRGYVKERRKSPRDDLLSELIRAESEGNKLTEDELVTTAILLLNAGHEATVHAIGNGVKALLELGIRDNISRRPRRGTAALRCAAASLHPLCARRPGLCRHPPRARARKSACCWAPPIAIRRALPSPTVSIPPASPIRM